MTLILLSLKLFYSLKVFEVYCKVLSNGNVRNLYSLRLKAVFIQSSFDSVSIFHLIKHLTNFRWAKRSSLIFCLDKDCQIFPPLLEICLRVVIIKTKNYSKIYLMLFIFSSWSVSVCQGCHCGWAVVAWTRTISTFTGIRSE